MDTPRTIRRIAPWVAVAAVAGGLLLAWQAANSDSTTEHGPFTPPLVVPWFGLGDDLEDNTGGWFGGLYLENPTDSDIEITAVWGLGVSDNLELGPVWRGRGTPDPVIWPAIDPDRLQVTPLEGDAIATAGSISLDTSLIIEFEVVPPGPGVLRGFRIDYTHESRPYRVFVDTYHCVAPSRDYGQCPQSGFDPVPWQEMRKEELTPIPFAQP